MSRTEGDRQACVAGRQHERRDDSDHNNNNSDRPFSVTDRQTVFIVCGQWQAGS